MSNTSIRNRAKTYFDIIKDYTMGITSEDGSFVDPSTAIAELSKKVSEMNEIIQRLSKDSFAEVSDTDGFASAMADPNAAVVTVSSGTFVAPTEPIQRSVILKGSCSGVSAATGDRCSDVTGEDETVLTGALSFSEGADAILDGLTVSVETFVSLAGNSDVTMRNCRIVDCAPDRAKSYLIKGTSFDNKVKLVLDGCYFGTNTANELGKMYNGLELQATLLDGSIISNCYFAKNCVTHNVINIYGIDEGATVYIKNNHFEYSANAIRLGVVGEPTCRIICEGNSYDATDPDPNWAGLMIIQPYGKQTTSHANMTVEINNTKHSDNGQLVYLFTNPSDTQFTEENKPKVYVNGVLQKLDPVEV